MIPARAPNRRNTAGCAFFHSFVPIKASTPRARGCHFNIFKLSKLNPCQASFRMKLDRKRESSTAAIKAVEAGLKPEKAAAT